MVKEALSPEVKGFRRLVVWAITDALLVSSWAVPLNFKERKKILERDGNQCQSKEVRIKHGGRLEVDHLTAKEFAEQVLGMTPHNHGHVGYNDPENLLSKCYNHHRGHPNSHHPDVHQALEDYRQGDKEAFTKVIKKHKEQSENKQIYWNNENDKEDRITAADLSAEMDKKHGGRRNWWPF